MPDHRILDDRLYPAKATAAVLTLIAMAGMFVMSLTRGYHDFYSFVVGAVTVGLAVGIGMSLRRRSRRRRGLDRGHVA